MIDTFTLLLVSAVVLQVMGLTLLAAWVSRRARGVLAATAATALIGAVVLSPVGY